MAIKLHETSYAIQLAEQMLEEWASEHDGDITDFPLYEELNKVHEDRLEKVLNLAVWVKNIRAEAEVFEKEKKRLEHVTKVLNRKADRIEEYIHSNLIEGEKARDARVAITWRKSTKLQINIPEEDWKRCLPSDMIKETLSLDKRELTAYVKQHFIDGVRLIEKQNLQIK